MKHSLTANHIPLRQVVLYSFLAILFFGSCYKETITKVGEGLEDWTTESHSGAASPNYDVVFSQTKVNKFIITISEDNWSDMQANLSSIYAASTGGPGGPGGANFSDETPNYFPCDVAFEGKNWYNVGIRYKGNSSLQASSNGEQKLPLRLDFDEFEDDYPEITNQTFFGFPALSMSSNYNDLSLMREKTANYLFLESGIPAPQSAFYEMYIDYGEGEVYFGLYTGVEIVFETMLNKQFGSEDGNCYKPEDDGAQFSSAGFSLSDFENKTTGGTGESDIQELFDVLHSSERSSDVDSWKASLETVFDVDGFLKWLAVNTTIQNWDTYGRMPHNYYLYHDPADDLIKWIPWDNNEAFEAGKQGGALSFEFSEIFANDWPLIGFIMQDDSYKLKFKNYVAEFIDGPFDVARMISYYEDIESLISSSVEAETIDYSFLGNYSQFTSAVSGLKTHCAQRNAAAKSFLQ